MEKLLKAIGRFTTPHLSKMIGSGERPIAFDWRLDTRPLPSNVPRSTAAGIEKKATKFEKKAIDVRRPYRILCLDGGGIRGILTTTILKRICKHNPAFLDNVDLIVGTSAGGLLSLLLASGYTADECDVSTRVTSVSYLSQPVTSHLSPPLISHHHLPTTYPPPTHPPTNHIPTTYPPTHQPHTHHRTSTPSQETTFSATTHGERSIPSGLSTVTRRSRSCCSATTESDGWAICRRPVR
jgi:hypothetical protein